MRKLLTLVAFIFLVSTSAFGASGGPTGNNSSGGPPTGAAGGDLGGTYPNPTVVSGAHLGAATVPNAALVLNEINNQGAIAAAGTVSCDLSLGNYCAFTVSSGTVTVAVPTNGVQGVQYFLQWSSSGAATVQYATATPGWRVWAFNTSSDENPPGAYASANGGSFVIGFHYDGTNYRLDSEQPNLYGNRIKGLAFTGGSFTGSTIAGSTGSYTGILKSTVGTGTNPAAILSTFGTCNSTTEGLYATQSDAAVACVAGVTAAAGGSTHCAIYCNGTNWVRTGL